MLMFYEKNMSEKETWCTLKTLKNLTAYIKLKLIDLPQKHYLDVSQISGAIA